MKKDRRGLYKCACGNVVAELLVPPSSYSPLEQNNLWCSCSDCVGFTRKVIEVALENDPNSPVQKREFFVNENTAVHNVFFFDTEITLHQGHEHVKALKLYESSFGPRLYTSCCGTPLGSMAPSSLVVLHPQNIFPYEDADENANNEKCYVDFPEFCPTHNFFRDSIPQTAEPPPPLPPGIKGLVDGKSVGFDSRYLARKAIHGIRSKGKGKGLVPYGDIPVGIDTIKLESAGEKERNENA